MRKVVGRLLGLVLLVLLVTACGEQSKINPVLTGMWGNQKTPYSYCGETVDVPLVFYVVQDAAKLTGTLKMGFPGNYLEGVLEGAVTAKAVQGTVIFEAGEQDQAGVFSLRLENDTLTGPLTFKDVPSCDGQAVEDFVMQIALSKGVDLPAPPADDALEPNDTKEQASAIEANSSHDLIFTYSNPDWFTFTLDKAQIITVNVTNSLNLTGSYVNVLLFDAQGQWIQPANNGDTTTSWVIVPGKYYLQLQMGIFGTPAIDYRLELSTQDVPDAAFEPNDSKDTAIAVMLPFTQTLYLTTQDQDWFRFDVTQSGLLDIQNPDGVQVVVYDANLMTISESYRETNIRSYKVGLEPGRFYILVGDMMMGGQSKSYQLQVKLEGLPDQSLEPNNSFNNATPITLPLNQALYMAKNDEDWFKFSVSSEQLLLFSANIPASNCYGGFTIELFDANGSSVGGSSINESFDEAGSTDAQILSSGTYYLKIRNENTLYPCAKPYQLKVASENLVDANLEPNNTKEQAVTIDFGFDRDIVVTQNDEDWFKFTLVQSTQIQLSLKGFTKYYMQISLLREDNSSVSFTQEAINGYSVATPILTAGTYYVKAGLYFGYPTSSKSQIKFEKK